MVKLYIWFNVNRNHVYHKFCSYCSTPIGSYNQYGHLLLDILEYYDNRTYSCLIFKDKYSIAAKKRNKRYKRLLNRFIKK